MSNTNKTIWILWAWRIAFTAFATLWIGNSALAQVELVEQLPYETETLYESVDGAAKCGCDQSPPRNIRSGLPCRTHRGKICGVVSGVKHSAAMLSHRESPTGDMGLHFPYQATQMYYYRRPYNHLHVPIHVQESNQSAARSVIGENLGYSNQIFDQAHELAEAYLNSEGLEVDKDGLLEYVDYKKHQQDRLAWEAKPEYEAEQRTEQRVILAPADDEEGLNNKTSGQEVIMPSNLSVSKDRVSLIRLQSGFSARHRTIADAIAKSP